MLDLFFLLCYNYNVRKESDNYGKTLQIRTRQWKGCKCAT